MLDYYIVEVFGVILVFYIVESYIIVYLRKKFIVEWFLVKFLNIFLNSNFNFKL